MTFRIALSGLNAASSDLNVTANNIANSATTGFKGSRAEFADVYAASTFGLSRTATGNGVRLAQVAQQFDQGSIEFTNNSLDLALSGEGFFTLSDSGSVVYSRAGNFGTDRDGYVVNAAGQRLQVFPAIDDDSFDTGRLSDLRLSTADNPPSATSTIEVGTNLPAAAAVPANGTFDPSDPLSYNHTTSLTVFDSLGATHVASLYYVKTANSNEWNLHGYIDGNPVGAATGLTYSTSGALTTPAGGSVALPVFAPTNGAAPINLTLELAGSSQFGDQFGVNRLTQDGYTTGRLTGIEVTQEGVIQARYSNGQASPLGQLVISNFSNAQGLQQLGDTGWGETFAAGQVQRGAAGTGSFGLVQAGALEASNVDLTEQLVNMITAQRNFQANAQMISTADQITQTIINIR